MHDAERIQNDPPETQRRNATPSAPWAEIGSSRARGSDRRPRLCLHRVDRFGQGRSQHTGTVRRNECIVL